MPDFLRPRFYVAPFDYDEYFEDDGGRYGADSSDADVADS